MADHFMPQEKLESQKIFFVSHDAKLYGAQMIAFHIIKVLHEMFHYDIYVLLKFGGPLENDLSNYATVYNLETDFTSNGEVEDLILSIQKKGVGIAICNTVVSGDLIEIFYKNNIRTVSLIHELPILIKEYGMEENAMIISRLADSIIFPSEYVRSGFTTIVPVDESKSIIAPQGLYLQNNFKKNKYESRAVLRRLLSLPQDSKIILAAGRADSRKGSDLFSEVAENIIRNDQDVHFIWAGEEDYEYMKNIHARIDDLGLKKNIHFVGYRNDVGLFYAGADLYLMTSREDPFPSTVLEAMDAGLAVIGFEDAGGFKDVVTQDTGILVSYLNVGEMAEAIKILLNDPERLKMLGLKAVQLIEEKYNYLDYVHFLYNLIEHPYKSMNKKVLSYEDDVYPLVEKFQSTISKLRWANGQQSLLSDQLQSTTAELQSTTAELQSTTAELVAIRKTILWRISRKIYNIMDKLLHFNNKK